MKTLTWTDKRMSVINKKESYHLFIMDIKCLENDERDYITIELTKKQYNEIRKFTEK